MFAVDFIGFLITILVVSLRYPHFAVLATLIHEAGLLCMASILNKQVSMVLSAGAFSTAIVGNASDGVTNILITFSGPLANYIFCAALGGIDQERPMNIINPYARLVNPFAVINLRIAIASAMISMFL